MIDQGRPWWYPLVTSVLAVSAWEAGAFVSANAALAQPPANRPEVPVTVVDMSSGQAHNSPAMAVDPTEPRFVALAARIDAPDFGCTLDVSGNGGRGWVPAVPVPELPAGAEKCYAPEVAFDADGTLYYLFVGLAGPGNAPVGVFLTTSSDRARSFSTPRQVLGPNTFMVRMAMDPSVGPQGRLHLVWLAPGSQPSLGGFPSGDNPILAAHSDDGGRSFSDPVRVSDPERRRAVAPALALGADGAVHVAYYDLQDDAVDYQGLEGPTWAGVWSVVTSTSRDGGASFESGVVVDDEVVPPERVMLIFTMAPPALVAQSDGTVFTSWHDARHGDWDVFLARSADGGRSWDEPRRLNDDPQGNGRHQYLPRLDVAPDGRLDAIFYDRRDDPDNVDNDVSFTSSTDGGATFARSEELTSFPSSSEIGARYPIPSAIGLVEVGSRLALVSGEGEALAAWTDTRNSLPGEQQDIFATEVVFGDEEDGETPRGVPGVALSAGGVLLAAIGVVAWQRARRRRARSDVDPTGGEHTSVTAGPEEAGPS